jgi:hypothetical protein
VGHVLHGLNVVLAVDAEQFGFSQRPGFDPVTVLQQAGGEQQRFGQLGAQRLERMIRSEFERGEFCRADESDVLHGAAGLGGGQSTS